MLNILKLTKLAKMQYMSPLNAAAATADRRRLILVISDQISLRNNYPKMGRRATNDHRKRREEETREKRVVTFSN
jgi:hypothetical protein